MQTSNQTPGRMLRAGVIGLGVGNRHCDAYRDSGVALPTGVCDLDRAKCEEIRTRHPEVKIYGSAEALIDDPSIDVVSIASYDNSHAAYAIRAIERSKHVYVEKPLCLTDAELERITNALSQNPDVKLSSNLVLRTNPRFRKLKTAIAQGEYGEVFLVEADYHYGRLHKLTEGWRGDLPFYSVVHGGMIHLLDLARWIISDTPVSIQAIGNQIATRDSKFNFPDCVVSLIQFSSGIILKASANFGCVKPHYHAFNVYGTRGSFENDTPNARIYRSRDPEVSFETDSSDYIHQNKRSLLIDFVQAIQGNHEPPISAEDTIASMRFSLAVQKALETGQKIEF